MVISVFPCSDGGFLTRSQVVITCVFPCSDGGFLTRSQVVISRVFPCSDGGFLTRSQESKDSFAPAVPPKMLGYHDDENSLTDQGTYDLPIYNEPAYLVSTTRTLCTGGQAAPCLT